MKKNRPAGSSRGGPRRSVDRDGVVRVELRRGGPPLGWLALGLAAASLLAFLLWQRRQAEPAHPASLSAPTASARARSKEALRLRVAVRSPDTAAPSNAHVIHAEAPKGPSLPSPDEPSDDSPEEAAIAPEEGAAQPSMGSPADRAKGPARPKTGIAVFPAPGTKRIKPGLKVPEDFALPPGYMRHYQATDKGQMLEPILVYHPDYELVDANGQVIPLPPDRVVPPDRAPEGLPLDTLEIPTDAYVDRDEHGPGTNADPGQTGVEEEKPADGEP